MNLYAISDLHLRHPKNLEALNELPKRFADDWLIVAGDIGEVDLLVRFAFSLLSERFARVFWTPGNHDLWTMPSDKSGRRGVAKYEHLVRMARHYGIVTPEDDFVEWPDTQNPYVIAPIFLGYDYSFRPSYVARENVLDWAAKGDVLSTDEALLHAAPFPDVDSWCRERCQLTESRLAAASQRAPLVLINHYPLRQDHAILPRVPRFTPWCGTTKTHDWHTRFRAKEVIYGHLHIRKRRELDGTSFREVSLGYPGQWEVDRGIAHYLQKILTTE